MDFADIIEFRTTWDNEGFKKKKSIFAAAKRSIRKSLIIVQIRSGRQLRYTENNLTKELQAMEHDQQLLSNYRHSHSLAENLQQRLKALRNEIDSYNLQIKNLVHQEKDYWKQLEHTIAERTKSHRVATKNVSVAPNRPTAVGNATYTLHVDRNDENKAPSESNTPVKIPKIRKKKKCVN